MIKDKLILKGRTKGNLEPGNGKESPLHYSPILSQHVLLIKQSSEESNSITKAGYKFDIGQHQ